MVHRFDDPGYVQIRKALEEMTRARPGKILVHTGVTEVVAGFVRV